MHKPYGGIDYGALLSGRRILLVGEGEVVCRAEEAFTAQGAKVCRIPLPLLDRAEALGDGKPILVMMHFPPRTAGDPETPFTGILERRKRVKAVVHGHLHGEALAAAFSGEERGIRYYPVSCDGIGFRPLEIPWP